MVEELNEIQQTAEGVIERLHDIKLDLEDEIQREFIEWSQDMKYKMEIELKKLREAKSNAEYIFKALDKMKNEAEHILTEVHKIKREVVENEKLKE